MGIKVGATIIIDKIKNGIYNKNGSRYNILVDGEYMRYKGMLKFNEAKAYKEVAIAKTSFDFLLRTVGRIQHLMQKEAHSIVVFMDGVRVRHKETGRRVVANVNIPLLRQKFQDYCTNFGFRVEALLEGEAELQMYLQRDKTANLNILVTDDSDMIAICYNHIPRSSDGKFNRYKQSHAASGIMDTNSVYSLTNEVFDSCLWIKNIKTGLVAIGLDFNQVSYDPFQFLVYISLCGTDFTDNLVTNSMVAGIIDASVEDKQFINDLDDFHEIVACFLYLGLKSGGTAKRFKNGNGCSLHNFQKVFERYRNYIETGEMDIVDIETPAINDVCKTYVMILTDNQMGSSKKSVNAMMHELSLSCVPQLVRKYSHLTRDHVPQV